MLQREVETLPTFLYPFIRTIGQVSWKPMMSVPLLIDGCAFFEGAPDAEIAVGERKQRLHLRQ
jgi:hypothetical protein